MAKMVIKMKKWLFAMGVAALVVACGGGGGGGGGASRGTAQLATAVADWSSASSTFVDASRVSVQVAGDWPQWSRMLAQWRRFSLWPLAHAQSLPQCNDSITPVVVSNTDGVPEFAELTLTEDPTAETCFVASREVGDYVAAQARNLYQGDTRCDLVLIPKSGGTLFCFAINLPPELASAGPTAALDILLNEAEGSGGYQLPNLYFAQLTQNGRYFFVAFRMNEVQGVYRLDLGGAEPKGTVAFLRPLDRTNNMLYDGGGYRALENGDLMVGLGRSVPGDRDEFFYVVVPDQFPGMAGQRLALVWGKASGLLDTTRPISLSVWAGTPLFDWAKQRWPNITEASTMSPILSYSADPAVKRFFTTLTVNDYQNLGVEATVLVRGTVSKNGIVFEDFGPTTFGFYGASWQSADLQKIYAYETNSNPVRFTVRRLTDESANVQVAGSTVVYPEHSTNTGFTSNIFREFTVYQTRHYLYFGGIPEGWFDEGSTLPTSLYQLDKRLGNGDDSAMLSGMQAIASGSLALTNQNLKRVYPSLTTDKLFLRVQDAISGLNVSAEVTPQGIQNVIDLGPTDAVPARFAVVAGS